MIDPQTRWSTVRVVASLSFLSGSVALYLYQYLQCLFLHIVDIITHMLDLH